MKKLFILILMLSCGRHEGTTKTTSTVNTDVRSKEPVLHLNLTNDVLAYGVLEGRDDNLVLIKKNNSISTVTPPDGYTFTGFKKTKKGILLGFRNPDDITYFLPYDGSEARLLPRPYLNQSSISKDDMIFAMIHFKDENSVGDLFFKSSNYFNVYHPDTNSTEVVKLNGNEGPISIDTMQVCAEYCQLYHTILKKSYNISQKNSAVWGSLTSTNILMNDQVFDMSDGTWEPISAPPVNPVRIAFAPRQGNKVVISENNQIIELDVNNLNKTVLYDHHTGIGKMFAFKQSYVFSDENNKQLFLLKDGNTSPILEDLILVNLSVSNNNISFVAEDMQGNKKNGILNVESGKSDILPYNFKLIEVL